MPPNPLPMPPKPLQMTVAGTNLGVVLTNYGDHISSYDATRLLQEVKDELDTEQKRDHRFGRSKIQGNLRWNIGPVILTVEPKTDPFILEWIELRSVLETLPRWGSRYGFIETDILIVLRPLQPDTPSLPLGVLFWN